MSVECPDQQSSVTTDVLGPFEVRQRRHGYRLTEDTLLLFRSIDMRRARRILEIGSGHGVLCLLLSRRFPSARIVGVEIQAPLHDLAIQNVQMNRADDRIRLIRGDIRDPHPDLGAGSFDMVVSNPPYRAVRAGRPSPVDERQSARFEECLTLDDLCRAASSHLRHHGVFHLIHLAERASSVLVALSAHGLEPKRLTAVHPGMDHPGSHVLIKAVKGARPGLIMDPPLVGQKADGRLSELEKLCIEFGTL